MKNPKFYVIQNHNNYRLMPLAEIVKPKEGDYFLYGNNILIIVAAHNCEQCFFYRSRYCKLMFLEKGNIHCDYDSHINFQFIKKIYELP